MTGSGYCVKCKKSVEIKNAKTVSTKNGRNMLSGTCGSCGTKVHRFLPKATPSK